MVPHVCEITSSIFTAFAIDPVKSLDLTRLLLRHKLDPNAVDRSSTSLLLDLVRRYEHCKKYRSDTGTLLSAAELLLKHGADPNKRTIGGETAIGKALSPELVALLKKYEAVA